MALLLSILLWLLFAALVVVLLLLVTPLQIQLQLTARPNVSVQLYLRALGGLTPRIPILDGKETKPKTDEVTKPKPKRKRRNKAKSSKHTGRLVRAAPRFLGDILNQIHFDRLQIDCDFGLGDPAETGQLAGVVLALTHGLPPSQRVMVAARPNFERRCFEGEILAVVHLTIAAFLGPILRFAWRGFGPVT